MSFNESYNWPGTPVVIGFFLLLLICHLTMVFFNRKMTILPNNVALVLPISLILFFGFAIKISLTLTPGSAMLFLIAILYYFLKTYLFYKQRRRLAKVVPCHAFLTYLFIWPGMHLAPFLDRKSNSIDLRLFTWPLLNLGIGSGLFLITKNLVKIDVAATHLLFIAISLVLHFGIINGLAAICVNRGYNVGKPFSSPLLAENLATFWSGSWNKIYSVMVAILLYKPLSKKTTKVWALVLTFAFSGFLHEIAISLPVKAGFGKPTIYFLIQALVLILLNTFDKKISNQMHKVILFFTVVIPLPLLFHSKFIDEIILPLIGH